MTVKDKSRRRVRREVLTQFNEGFDFARLDYDRRIRPLRGKAIMLGLIAASLIYFGAVTLAYISWQNQSLSYELFAKLVWIFLLPATVVGGVCWLIISNRLEYGIRQDIRQYIEQREAAGGWLWRFQPLQLSLLAEDFTAKKVMQLSQQAPLEMDAEDYARTVWHLQHQLQHSDQRQLTTDLAEQVWANLTSR